MCLGGGAPKPKTPEPVAAPIAAVNTKKTADLDAKGRRGFASTILSQTQPGNEGPRFGELKTLLGA